MVVVMVNNYLSLSHTNTQILCVCCFLSFRILYCINFTENNVHFTFSKKNKKNKFSMMQMQIFLTLFFHQRILKI